MLAYYLHNLDPIIFRIYDNVGPRWYGLAYVLAFVSSYFLFLWLAKRGYADLPPQRVGDFITGCALFGVIVGGRLGYVFFYKPEMLREPLSILRVWEGGMSSHGGMVGLLLFTFYYARRHKISWLNLGDNLVVTAPMGLFFGRCANFINGELYGRPSNVAWAMIFPNGGPVPRHPSQLYEAFCEGVMLFLLLFAAERLDARQRPGLVTGLFLAGYAVLRMSGELFREPDPQLGFLIFGTTMGQLLSIPLLLAGVLIVAWALRAPIPARS